MTRVGVDGKVGGWRGGKRIRGEKTISEGRKRKG
jgi:hypothetical protein